jgi:hypothetical protein
MSASELWARLANHFTPSDYECAGMIAPAPLDAPGFFPVCSGTWGRHQRKPYAKILFLGQDFGTVEGLTAAGERPDSPTWRNLSLVLSDVGVDASSCFFSNVIMGVRVRGSSSVGPAPAFGSQSFLKKCAAFLTIQLEVLRPRAIVVMGLHALGAMRFATSDLPQAKDFDEWDKRTGLLPIEITVGAWKGLMAVIVHPCHHNLNIRLRSPAGDPRTEIAGATQQLTLLRRLLAEVEKKGSVQ